MTLPVAEILERAQREGWPTSSIDAMANHHLCGNLARDYVNACFDTSEPAAGSETGALADPHSDAAPPGHAGAASTQPVQGEGMEADQNCPQCHGTGWRRPTPFEGKDDVRCGC